jgi:hypothetical protein
MDSNGSYDPVGDETGGRGVFHAQPTNVTRGARILQSLAIVFLVFLLITFILGIVNAVNMASRDASDKPLLQKLVAMTGLVSESAHRYSFSLVYDAVTRQPVLNPYDYFYGLPSGNAIAIVKGWVDLLWSVPPVSAKSTDVSGHVAYNISSAYPAGRALTGLEVVVTSFTPRSDHLVEKASLVLCGGAGSGTPSCSAQYTAGTGLYTGAADLYTAFARHAGAADDLHMAFFLIGYSALNGTNALDESAVLFVVELQR